MKTPNIVSTEFRPRHRWGRIGEGPQGDKPTAETQQGHVSQRPRECKSHPWPPGPGSQLCPLKGCLPGLPAQVVAAGWRAASTPQSKSLILTMIQSQDSQRRHSSRVPSFRRPVIHPIHSGVHPHSLRLPRTVSTPAFAGHPITMSRFCSLATEAVLFTHCLWLLLRACERQSLTFLPGPF